MVKILTTNKVHQSEIVVAFLEDHNIPAFSISKKDSAYNFGYYEVYVHQENETKALQLINDYISFE